MRRKLLNLLVAGAFVAGIATPASAQEVSRVAVSAMAARVSPEAVAHDQSPSPSRIALAEQLMMQLMPPENARAWAEGFALPMLSTMTDALEENQGLKQAMAAVPTMRPILDRFVDRVRTETLDQLVRDLPSLRAAMISAYARQFDETQLREITAFFSTPTGQFYNSQSSAIMQDRGVAAWQRQNFISSQERLQPMLEQFMAEVADAASKATPQ